MSISQRGACVGTDATRRLAGIVNVETSAVRVLREPDDATFVEWRCAERARIRRRGACGPVGCIGGIRSSDGLPLRCSRVDTGCHTLALQIADRAEDDIGVERCVLRPAIASLDINPPD